MRRLLRLALLLTPLAASPAAAQSGAGACPMGEPRNAGGGLVGELQNGLTIYQWFDPAACLFCLQFNLGVIELRTVELEVLYPLTNPLTTPLEVPATVTVLGWTGSPECPFPDESNAIVSPRAVTFIVPPKPPGPWAVPGLARAPLGSGPGFVSPAFVKVEFPVAPAGSLPFAPGLVFRAGCSSPCRQYQISTWSSGNLVDACAVADGREQGYVLRARGDCVAVTSARRASWASVKSFYR